MFWDVSGIPLADHLQRPAQDAATNNPDPDEHDLWVMPSGPTLPQLKSIFANLGAIKSVTFKRVEKNGANVSDVDFEHGSTDWHIIIAPNGDHRNFGISTFVARGVHMVIEPLCGLETRLRHYG